MRDNEHMTYPDKVTGGKVCPTVGVVIPTYNAASMIHRVLEPVLHSPLRPTVLVIDSSSRDETVAKARTLGVETIVIPQSEFSHGGTRELGRRHLRTDIVVMMTQDVIPLGSDMLDNLVAPIADGTAAVSYARQIPHDNAGLLEAFPRLFNYPPFGELRGASDIKRYGAYTFFCSNSCAAWSNAALDEIGGFGNTQSLEDTIAAAKLIARGYRIQYAAAAVVKHSHNYNLVQEFQRYFITGHVRSQHRDLLLASGGDEKRGANYTTKMLLHLLTRAPHLVPQALLVNFVKLAGYRMGYHGHRLPQAAKERLSGMKNLK